MKDYHINIFYSQEDDGYIADIPDLHYCSAFGRTPSEALTELDAELFPDAAQPERGPSARAAPAAGECQWDARFPHPRSVR